MATIYLVEDEANIRELVVYTLTASGYEALGFADAPAFYAQLEKQTPDLVLLDIMLPGEDGLSILKKLRHSSATASTPVMMLTAKNSEYDKVIGLDAGADDYLAKPFGMMEMVSRVKALLRRSRPLDNKPKTKLCHGSIVLMRDKHTVSVNDTPVTLTLKEFELLKLLLENPGVVFTRDNLLERIWDYNYEGETRTVDVHIRSLRQKLGDAGSSIETVRGVGYRLCEVK